jgi:hypothetical protein
MLGSACPKDVFEGLRHDCHNAELFKQSRGITSFWRGNEVTPEQAILSNVRRLYEPITRR